MRRSGVMRLREVETPALTHLAAWLDPPGGPAAGALRDPAGELVQDTIHDELRTWIARFGSPHRAVQPGTVAATTSGALAEQGIRRLYHLAVAVPKPGTNDYDVQPADVTRGVARAFAVLAAERRAFSPPLRSICFPLIGAGRGGLQPEASLNAVWAAVEAELARGGGWHIHFVAPRPANAALFERLLSM